ncbi:MAG: solute carrier family 26 protein [Myxococcota bacterium]
MSRYIDRFIPFQWLEGYTSRRLGRDTIAGLTTAVMLIPQAMAYAMLAGLPPIIGLYASIVPLAVYAALGSSRDLAVGPVAMVSLLVATGVGAVAEAGTQEYVAMAVLLSLMVGVMQFVMGVAKLGFLANFLSHPVISGFTSAAALIIGFSQLKHLMGVSLPRTHRVHEVLWQALLRAGETNLITLGMGVGAVAALVVLKSVRPMWPRALVVVALGTLATWGLGLAELGVKIVGEVPAGLPSPALPVWDVDALERMLPIAATIALVGFMESISVAKAVATKKGYEINADKELVGLGLANVAGAMFQAYPVTGGFSRTAVNANAGATSPMASLVTAAVIAISLLFFTPLFYFLPQTVLAAIIMTAVFGLIDTHEVAHLWKVKRSDLALLGLTFFATLGLGIEQGILLGVGTSMLWFVVRTTRPHTAILGRVPVEDDYTNAYRNVLNYPQAETYPGVMIVRMDAQFYFGNVAFLRDTLRAWEAEQSEPLHTLILDCSAMNELDSSADTALHELYAAYTSRGVNLMLAHVKGPVRRVMQRSGLLDKLGPDANHLTVHHAVVDALRVVREVEDGDTSTAA